MILDLPRFTCLPVISSPLWISRSIMALIMDNYLCLHPTTFSFCINVIHYTKMWLHDKVLGCLSKIKLDTSAVRLMYKNLLRQKVREKGHTPNILPQDSIRKTQDTIRTHTIRTIQTIQIRLLHVLFVLNTLKSLDRK